MKITKHNWHRNGDHGGAIVACLKCRREKSAAAIEAGCRGREVAGIANRYSRPPVRRPLVGKPPVAAVPQGIGHRDQQRNLVRGLSVTAAARKFGVSHRVARGLLRAKFSERDSGRVA